MVQEEARELLKRNMSVQITALSWFLKEKRVSEWWQTTTFQREPLSWNIRFNGLHDNTQYFVLFCQGERISEQEAFDRDMKEIEVHGSPSVYRMEIEKQNIVIDATKSNCIAKFINHSRVSPNLRTVMTKNKVFLKAIEDIPNKTFLKYDYKIPDVYKCFYPWIES